MSSPVVNSTEFVLVAENLRAVQINTDLLEESGSDRDPLLSARALIGVAMLGAAFWYVLWKVALHFWMML